MDNTPHNPVIAGSLRRSLFGLAGPMFASALLQNAQTLIDLFWVGRLGPDAVAALAVSGLILFLMWPIVMGLSIGTVALVSRHTGARNARAAGAAAGQSITLAVLAGLLIALTGGFSMSFLLKLIGPEPMVADLALQYLRISLTGFFTVLLLFVSISALQGAGNAMLPMTGMILANIINVILDPILIFGIGGIQGMGIQGAALATVIAQGIACLIVTGSLFRGLPHVRVGFNDLYPKLRLAWSLFRIGIFSAAQMLARSLMTFVLFRIVAMSGTAALAGYGIGMRFHQMILLPCFVLGNASAALVGQNLGAGRPDRAVQAAWMATRLGMGLNLAAAVILITLAESLTGLFTEDVEVIAVGASYLRIVSFFYIFAALGIVLGRSMNGAGDTLATLLITLITLWGIQVPLAYAFATLFQPATHGVWWSIAVSNTLNGLLTCLWFVIGRWKHRSLV